MSVCLSVSLWLPPFHNVIVVMIIVGYEPMIVIMSEGQCNCLCACCICCIWHLFWLCLTIDSYDAEFSLACITGTANGARRGLFLHITWHYVVFVSVCVLVIRMCHANTARIAAWGREIHVAARMIHIAHIMCFRFSWWHFLYTTGRVARIKLLIELL